MPEKLSFTVENVGYLSFGRALRLQVGLWVVHKGLEELFYPSKIGHALAYPHTTEIAKELGRFAELEMVMETPHEEPPLPRYFHRLDNSGWDVIAATEAALVKAGTL